MGENCENSIAIFYAFLMYICINFDILRTCWFRVLRFPQIYFISLNYPSMAANQRRPLKTIV